MSSSVVMSGSGDTSQDSGRSQEGGQKSMLELLSITDAAVKALNKSVHSASSHGSQKSSRGDPLQHQSAPSTMSDKQAKSIQMEQFGLSGQSSISDHSGQSQHSVLSVDSSHSVKSQPTGQSVKFQLSGQSVKSQQYAISDEHNQSDDSGIISKLHTVSDGKSKSRGITVVADEGIHERSSDESTTASDVLIRSTLDKSGKSIIVNGNGENGSSSISSKCSKVSYGVENFNSSGPQKVKISKKHLKEIKSPYDNDPRDSVSSDGKVPSSLLIATGKANSNKNGDINMKHVQEISSRGKTSDVNSALTKTVGKSFPKGVDSEQFKVEKVRTSATKPSDDVNMNTKGHSKYQDPSVQGIKDGHFDTESQSISAGVKTHTSAVNVIKDNITDDQAITKKSSVISKHVINPSKYVVERHSPKKSQTNIEAFHGPIPEKKNLIHALEESIEIVTTHACDHSICSEPDIVTVPERIVTVSSRATLSPTPSDNVCTSADAPLETWHSSGFKLIDDKRPLGEEKTKALDDSNMIPPALTRHCARDDMINKSDGGCTTIPARAQWFARQATGHGLQQGAMVSGLELPDKHNDEDVLISDFKLSEKQKLAKECFARRQGGPVKRIVQPRLVGHDVKAGSASSAGDLKVKQQNVGQPNDHVLTAAAAASAAVAATQPFLKSQYDLEARMAEILAKINELQSGAKHKSDVPIGDTDRIKLLERQLADMTERRIEYIERLQEQQLTMQARLVSMTQESTRPYQARSYSHESHCTEAPVTKKAFSKTTVAQQPIVRDYTNNNAFDTEDLASHLDTPVPRARVPKPTIYNASNMEYRSRVKSPNPRSPVLRACKPRSRSPAKEKQDRGILHQILASSDSPTREALSCRDNSSASCVSVPDICESPNVRKAKGLIEDLSVIKEQVKGLVKDTESWKGSKATASSLQDALKEESSHEGPSPLDNYLKLPDHEPTSPYKSFPDVSFGHFNAPLLPGFKDAKDILHKVQQNRGYLESNLAAVLRARQEVEVYSMLEAVYSDSTDNEKARIKKMVDKSIQKLRREVEREVTDDVVLYELRKHTQNSVPGAVKVPEPIAPSKPTSKTVMKGRLQQQKLEPKVEPKKLVPKKNVPSSKETGPSKWTISAAMKTKSLYEDEAEMTRVYGKAPYQKGRTTVKDPYLHFQNTSKPKVTRPSTQAVVQGTEMMSSKTQTVGGGVKQFYFNPSSGTYIPIQSTSYAPIQGHLIAMAVPLGGPRMDSGLTQPITFTPAMGPVTFQPGERSQVTADSNVVLVSIETQQESKYKAIPELAKQVLPSVDIDTESSEMSEIIKEKVSSKPTSTTPERKPKKHVKIVSPSDSPDKTPSRSPGKAHYEVVFSQVAVDDESTVPKPEVEAKNSNNGALSSHQTLIDHDHVTVATDDESTVPKPEEEEAKNSTNSALSSHQTLIDHDHDTDSNDTLEDADADVETATGLELPGYQQQEAQEIPYHGPVFPPKMPSNERQLTADLIAEDIKRRDLLQNKAMEWLEQELMARIIMEVYPLKDAEEPTDLSHVVSETSEDSMAEEKQQSMFVMDTIGHRGMQLFVDAGYPIDNTLVNQLTKEVLTEKVRTMLGEKPDQGNAGSLALPAGRSEPQWEEEPISEELEQLPVHRQQVVTPEPTPRASPRSTPPKHVAHAPTPLASPTGSSPIMAQVPFEYPEPVRQQTAVHPVDADSESESSASYDIKEALGRLAEQLLPAMEMTASVKSMHDISTPPESPKPQEQPFQPQRPLTPPELSPRTYAKETINNSRTVIPAGSSYDPTPPRSKSDEPKSASSPQVTDLAEEELTEDQPKPVVFTVAETQTDIQEKPKSRSPSPTKSASISSESSFTETSSISDTLNECLSEGQWLINKSFGEVADFPINEAALRDRMLRMSQRKVDVSSASTWKDIDDKELDEMTDASRSEGEFLYKSEFPPEKDPVLDLLARLQSSVPQLGMYNMSQRQVIDVLGATGKSEGEVIQVAAHGQQMKQPAPQFIPEHDAGPVKSNHSKSPARSESPQANFRKSENLQQKAMVPQEHSLSPYIRTQSPTRVSFEGDNNNDNRPRSPTRGILKRSSTFDGQPYRSEDVDLPVKDSGMSKTVPGRYMPGGRQPQIKGMIGAGGRTPSAGKSSRKPPQLHKSASMPDSNAYSTRHSSAHTSYEDHRDSLENTGASIYYGSDTGTIRTMTPDQMNLDSLIQSGYLSQSFSQSDPGGRQTGQSSVKSSGDLRASGTSANGRSLGYSYDSNSTMSLSELQRLATHGTGKLQMSVTLPGTEQDESDLSEIDVTDPGNTK